MTEVKKDQALYKILICHDKCECDSGVRKCEIGILTRVEINLQLSAQLHSPFILMVDLFELGFERGCFVQVDLVIDLYR